MDPELARALKSLDDLDSTSPDYYDKKANLIRGLADTVSSDCQRRHYFSLADGSENIANELRGFIGEDTKH